MHLIVVAGIYIYIFFFYKIGGCRVAEPGSVEERKLRREMSRMGLNDRRERRGE